MREGGRHSGFAAGFVAATSEVLPHLIAALKKAYDDAREAHVMFPGSNNTTFGTNLYHFACHEILEAGDRTGVLKKLEDEAPKFRFLSGGLRYACHNVGLTEHDDIETSFPRGHGASSMIREQLVLPGIGVAPGVESLRSASRVVVAHMGNPQDGLCAIYLCIASGDVEDEKIKEWAYTLCAWKREQPAKSESNTSAAAPTKPIAPESEATAEPRRRVRRDRREETK